MHHSNLVRITPATLSSRAKGIYQLLGLQSKEQLAPVLMRAPSLLKSKPSSLAAKKLLLTSILRQAPAERMSQVRRRGS